MNPNEFYKDDPEKWKIFCYRFVGRCHRLENLKELRCPEFIIEKEKELIQGAYEEMREGCLADEDYVSAWEPERPKNNN